MAKTSEPKWLEQFDMHVVNDQTKILDVAVYDKRKDVCIGRYNILQYRVLSKVKQSLHDFTQFSRSLVDLSNIESEKTHHEWYNLDEGSSGKIFLLISISGRNTSTGVVTNEPTDSMEQYESKSTTEYYVMTQS